MTSANYDWDELFARGESPADDDRESAQAREGALSAGHAAAREPTACMSGRRRRSVPATRERARPITLPGDGQATTSTHLRSRSSRASSTLGSRRPSPTPSASTACSSPRKSRSPRLATSRRCFERLGLGYIRVEHEPNATLEREPRASRSSRRRASRELARVRLKHLFTDDVVGEPVRFGADRRGDNWGVTGTTSEWQLCGQVIDGKQARRRSRCSRSPSRSATRAATNLGSCRAGDCDDVARPTPRSFFASAATTASRGRTRDARELGAARRLRSSSTSSLQPRRSLVGAASRTPVPDPDRSLAARVSLDGGASASRASGGTRSSPSSPVAS